MDPSELISLKEQVADLETALLSDPNNEDLLTCKTELLELISLTETLLQQEQQLGASNSAAPVESPVAQASGNGVSATSSPYRTSTASGSGASTPITSTPASTTASKGSNQPIYQPPAQTRHWAVGDRCRALYAEDGKYYEATILAVADGAQAYSVQYTGYANSPPVTLGSENLKPLYDPKKHQQHTPAAATASGDSEEVKAGQKRGPDGGAGAGAGAGSGMKKKKKADAGPSEQVQKQMAWQNFAKGKTGAKKGKTGTGIGLKKSIFATPDNPEGKGNVS
jgi:survival-of-motor-neuron-related-splicing factor 30